MLTNVKLSEAEQSLLTFIHSMGNKILKMSIYEIADRAFVSPATVTRLIHKLGYEKMANFRLEMCYLVANQQKIPSFNKQNINKAKNEVLDIYQNLITNSNHPFFDHQVLEKVVNTLLKSKVIIGYANGTSRIPIIALQNQMLKLGFAFLYFANSVATMHSLTTLNQESVLIIFSVKANDNSFEKIFNLAKNKKIKIILITANKKIRPWPNLIIVNTSFTQNQNNFLVTDNFLQMLFVEIISLILYRTKN